MVNDQQTTDLTRKIIYETSGPQGEIEGMNSPPPPSRRNFIGLVWLEILPSVYAHCCS